MKQKDIALIIVISFISAVIALFVSKAVFPAQKRHEPAEVVDAITADFPTLDQKYFNNASLNPTKLIKIGDSSNTKPFN